MCWATYNKELIVPKIAEDNIVCNKLVRIDSNNIIKSDYYSFIYSLNTVYKLDKQLIVNIYSDRRDKLFYEICQGFHSYSTNVAYRVNEGKYLDKRKNSLERIRTYYGDKLLDSYSIYEYLNGMRCQISLASCIIPKGSTYFLNEAGEYVSDSIKMLSIFKINGYG